MSPANPPSDCPLSPRQQTRNLLIYAANWAVIYLAAPVTYVGVIQATFLQRLGFDTVDANLPASVFLWSTPLAVVVAWCFPQARLLKPLLIGSFTVTAVLGGCVALATLYLSPEAVRTALLVHALVWGVANGIVATCQWEMLGRGVAERRRGQALAAAFGVGPVLAVFASLGTQLVLAKEPALNSWVVLPEPPGNFALIFGLSVPVLLWAAVQSSLFVLPPPEREAPRRPKLSELLRGALDYFGHRLILIAAAAYVLVHSGHMIHDNLSLYTEVILDEKAEHYAGLLQAYRFGFKIVAGFFFGWLLTRSNPRLLLLVTACFTLASIAWASTLRSSSYLLCFGILGAGELFGVYYPNYILGCSSKEQMRLNMAFTGLITLVTGFAPLLYGWIVDRFAESYGRDEAFRMSFAVAATAVIAALAVVLVALPPHPHAAHRSLGSREAS